ncbi:unnamed protein product [Orchesella dallaii]
MDPCNGESYFYKLDNLLLNSLEIIRNLFKDKWFIVTRGTNWKSTEEQGKLLMNIISPKSVFFRWFPFLQSVYLYFQNFPVGVIAKGCLEDWDLSILSLILQHLRAPDLYQDDFDGLKALTELRNALNNNPQKTLSSEEYNEKVEILKKSLLNVRVEDVEIEKLINRAGVSCSATAMELQSKLLVEADCHLAKEEFDKAIEFYDKAITTPNQPLIIHQAVVFEKRAECYMKIAQRIEVETMSDLTTADREKNELYEKAIADAVDALDRNITCWNAHYILGQCFTFTKHFLPAIFHYKRALTIGPQSSQKQVKMELESCKALAGLNPTIEKENNNPWTLGLNAAFKAEVKETLFSCSSFEVHESSMGAQMNESLRDTLRLTRLFEKFPFKKAEEKEFLNTVYKIVTASDNVFIHACFSILPRSIADNIKTIVCQMYNEKCKNNTEANEEDMKIRFCYIHFSAPCGCNCDTSNKKQVLGLGENYLELAIEGLQMYPNNPHYHELVADAYRPPLTDFASGLRYAEEGLKRFPNHLGLLYIKATYTDYCDTVGPAKVIQAYRDFLIKAPHDHPNVPNGYFGIARLYGRDVFSTDGRKQNRGVKQVKRYCWFANAIEECSGVSSVGVSAGNKEIVERVASELEKSETEVSNSNDDPNCMQVEELGGWMTLAMNFSILYNKAMEGSSIVGEVKKKMVGAESLTQALEQEGALSEIEKEFIVVQLYRIATPDFDFFSIPTNLYGKLQSVVGELFEKKCGNEVTNDDMRIRFCYVGFNLGLAQMQLNESPKDLGTVGVKLLKEGIEMYPDNSHYYQLLCGIFAFLEDYESGLLYVTQGLKKFPDCEGLFYLKAVLLQLQQGSQTKEQSEEVITAYNEFLKKVPKDHRKVPHTYYGIGCEYIRDLFEGNEAEKSQAGELIKRYYQKGLESEKYLLPCHLNSSFATNKGREVISYLVRLIDSNVLPRSSLSPTSPSPTEAAAEGNGNVDSADPTFGDIFNKVLQLPLTPNLNSLFQRQAKQLKQLPRSQIACQNLQI